MAELNGTIEVPAEAWAILHDLAHMACVLLPLEDRYQAKQKLARCHELERKHSRNRQIAEQQAAE